MKVSPESKPCEACGATFHRAYRLGFKQWEKRRFCSPACVMPRPRAEHTIYPYRRVKIGGKTVLEHRHVMSLAIGRELLRSEHVHHKNGIRSDNRIENLELMDATTHARHHKLKHPIVKLCAICGVEFTPHKTKRERQQTCTRRCGLVLSAVKRHGHAPPVAEAIVRSNYGRQNREVAA